MCGDRYRYGCGGNARESFNPQDAGEILTFVGRRKNQRFPDGLLLVILIVIGAGLGKLQTIARNSGHVDLVSRILQFTVNPIALPISHVLVQTGEFSNGLFHARAITVENAALKAQLIGYEAYAERVDLLESQIDSDRKLLNLPPATRKVVNLDVVGISKEDGSLILNGGSELGIKPDQPVINGEGLVGLVQTVSKGECRVAMLTSYGVEVFGVDGSRTPPEEGLIRGTGESTLTMRMLNPKDPVASGDTILTSLKSKNIPGGKVIGRVISVEDDPYFGTHKLTVDPAVDLGTVHEVQVLE